jgi:hypothetical protein
MIRLRRTTACFREQYLQNDEPWEKDCRCSFSLNSYPLFPPSLQFILVSYLLFSSNLFLFFHSRFIFIFHIFFSGSLYLDLLYLSLGYSLILCDHWTTTLTPISIMSTLMLSIHLRLGLPSGRFPSGFPTNNLCAFVFSPIRRVIVIIIIIIIITSIFSHYSYL